MNIEQTMKEIKNLEIVKVVENKIEELEDFVFKNYNEDFAVAFSDESDKLKKFVEDYFTEE